MKLQHSKDSKILLDSLYNQKGHHLQAKDWSFQAHI